MKYLFLKNKLKFKDNILKFYLIQLLFIFTYIFINGSAITYFDLDQYSYILGLVNIIDANIFYVITKVMTYLIIIYLIVKMFIDSINNTIEYIMIRANTKKWLLLEIINFIFYVAVMRIILNIEMILCFVLFESNIKLTSYLYMLLIDLLFNICLLLLVILSLNLFSLKNGKNLLGLIPIFIIFLSLFKNLSTIPFYIYIIFSLILIIVNIKLFSPSKFYNKYCTK